MISVQTHGTANEAKLPESWFCTYCCLKLCITANADPYCFNLGLLRSKFQLRNYSPMVGLSILAQHITLLCSWSFKIPMNWFKFLLYERSYFKMLLIQVYHVRDIMSVQNHLAINHVGCYQKSDFFFQGGTLKKRKEQNFPTVLLAEENKLRLHKISDESFWIKYIR